MSNIILTDSHNVVHWKPVTGTKGENFYMSKDEKYYISRPVFSRKGIVVEAKSFDDAKHKAQNQLHTFTSEDLFCLSTKAISAMDEGKTTHEYC